MALLGPVWSARKVCFRLVVGRYGRLGLILQKKFYFLFPLELAMVMHVGVTRLALGVVVEWCPSSFRGFGDRGVVCVFLLLGCIILESTSA
jgi:hypothetical protein